MAVIGTGATAIQVIAEIADKVGRADRVPAPAQLGAPLNNGLISDAGDGARSAPRYDEIFAHCARTPGGFEHEPDRRGFYDVAPAGARGVVGQAL